TEHSGLSADNNYSLRRTIKTFLMYVGMGNMILFIFMDISLYPVTLNIKGITLKRWQQPILYEVFIYGLVF
ncbi:hypothetical protein, partial [Xenorhabdus bovienii]|uniref:hypothetical protein n=1 Tax=Xenorhabdus bovienii TaxID=40576 RepID=UPI0023B28B0A